MEVSEARLAANKANASRSKGPTSDRGKSISRRNSLKHGLTSQVVVPEGDQAEVESRVEALRQELRPQTALGSILIRKIATLSVRSERAAERENAAIAERVRNAADDFDERRNLRVDNLFETFPVDPRAALRNLRRMPEGVDRLVEAWRVLRRDLERDGPNRWGSAQLARAANLAGIPHLEVHSTRIGDLSCATWGEFHGLADHDGGDLDDPGRRDWARRSLMELIDAQVAELEAHRETLDLDRIEQDRLEAPARSRFDDSREASLARRYEADADRGFYKALKEFRQVESEAPSRSEADPDLPTADPTASRMGSFRAPTPPAIRERSPALLDAPIAADPPSRGPARRPPGRPRPLSPPA